MASISFTRGVPFDPEAAKELREAAQAKQQAVEKVQRKEELRAHGRMLDQQAAERRREERLRREAEVESRRQNLREHGKRLDEEAAARRRQIRAEMDAAYVERFSSDES